MNLEDFDSELLFSHFWKDEISVLYKNDLFLPHCGCMNLDKSPALFVFSLVQ